MSLPKVFVTRQILEPALNTLSKHADIELWPNDQPPTPDQLKDKSHDVDGLLTNIMDRIDADLLDAAPKLKVISQLSVGLDNIDLAEVTKRGIPVGYTPGILAKSTADLTFALIMAAARRVGESERWVRQGNWQLAHHPMHWLGIDIHESTLGIIGMGQIGQEVAKRARGFDMRILYYSRNRKPELESLNSLEYRPLPDLMKESDFISLHIPLNEETRHIINESQLKMMKSTAILINASRGPIVDPEALYKALNEKWIYSAALDVTEPEPIAPNSPLLSLENLIVTPHIGSAALPTRLNTMMLATRNLISGLNGNTLEACANAEVYSN